MRDQIRSQPAVLRSLLGRRDELASRLAVVCGRTGEPARRIWAVGHGDSYFAPLAAGAAFRTLVDRPYAAVLAQELTAYPPPGLDDESLVIVLSMSGSVGRSIAAAAAARARGARVLAITNTPGSRLSQVADEVILLNIAEPTAFLAGTVTYSACVLALLTIAGLLGERGGTAETRAAAAGASRALQAAIEAVDVALGAEAATREWIARFVDASVWYLLGMGAHVATARYGAAKLAEVADAVAIAQETEEFFHEQHWVVRPDHPVVILAHDAVSEQRAAAAAAHLLELGVPVWLVGQGSPPAGVRHIPVEPVEPWCAPLPAVVPLQWLAYWLSRAKGLDPDWRSHLRDSPRYVVSRKYR